MKSMNECLENIINNSNFILDSKDSDQLNLLQSYFRDLEASSRETFQEKLFPEAQNLVKKLQLGNRLEPKEEKILELLIIGDAEYYTKIENNFNDWMAEYKRLVNELQKVTGSSFTIDQVCRIRAMARDALNLLPSIVYFINARNRVEQFRQVMSGHLEREDRIMLASIVKTAMESDLQ